MRLKPETIRALALDMDGTTLLPGEILGTRTTQVLRRCLHRGLRLIFCTGRSVYSVEPYRNRIGMEGPMVYFNGAMVADMPAGKILNTVFLPGAVAEFCVELAREMGVYVQVYLSRQQDPLAEALYADQNLPEAELYRKRTGVQAHFGDVKQALRKDAGCLKCLFIASAKTGKIIRARLLEQFGTRIYITRSSPKFLEVLDAGASKGTGLAFIMEQLRLKPEEVIAFGDEENDLPLFRAAGYSAAPSDAQPEIRGAAKFVIGPCAEEGLAAFLEETFLNSI